MELLQLRYFCHAARLENFSKAAQLLCVPQSAISRTVSTLERELGCTLFDRMGRRVVLNSRGELFLRAVENALASIDGAVEQLARSNARTIKLLVLAATKLIPDLLADYSAESRSVNFALRQQPGDKDYDFRITAQPCAPGHECRVLMSENIVLAVPERHPLYLRDVISPQEIKDERLVGFARFKDMRALVDSYCAKCGFVPNIAYEAENAATFRGLVEQQLGIAFVPERVFRSSPSEGVRLISLSEPFERTLIIEWAAGRKPDAVGMAFCDFAVQWFESNA